MNYFSFLVVMVLLIGCGNSNVVTNSDIRQLEKWTTVASVASLVEDKVALKFIHVGTQESFQKEHIHSAIPVWRPAYTETSSSGVAGFRSSRDKMEQLLNKMGVQNNDFLVIYDAKANVDACRFAWILELYGFENYSLMDGGLKSWKLAGLTIQSGAAEELPPSNFVFSSSDDNSSFAVLEEVKEGILDSNTVIVDTREDYEFEARPFESNGEIFSYKKGAFTRGSIPTSVHLNWSTLVDLDGDHKLKPIEVLNYDLSKRGISKDKNVIVYCHSGSRSSHTSFVLREILQFPNVKNFDGSWIEWSYHSLKDSSIKVKQKVTDQEFEILYQELESQLSI